jgi:hypothetical protein
MNGTAANRSAALAAAVLALVSLHASSQQIPPTMELLQTTYDGLAVNQWSLVDSRLQRHICTAYAGYRFSVTNGGTRVSGDVTMRPLSICGGAPAPAEIRTRLAGATPPLVAASLSRLSLPLISQRLFFLVGFPVAGGGEMPSSHAGPSASGCETSCRPSTVECGALLNLNFLPITGVMGACATVMQGCSLTCTDSGGTPVLVGDGEWKILAVRHNDFERTPFTTLFQGTPAQLREAFNGLWYNPNESGWGLTMVFGSGGEEIPVVVLHVYSGTQPTWFIMPGGRWDDDWTFSGDLFATTGVDYRASSFDATRVIANKVGSLRVTLSPDNGSTPSATLDFSVRQSNGTDFQVTGKPIVKQEF